MWYFSGLVFLKWVVCVHTPCWTRTHSVARVPLELSNCPAMASQVLELGSYQVSVLLMCQVLHLVMLIFNPFLLAVPILHIIVLVPRERDVGILSLESFLHSCSMACSGIRKPSCQGLLHLNILCVFQWGKIQKLSTLKARTKLCLHDMTRASFRFPLSGGWNWKQKGKF